jgi:formyl-CoA transferase
MSLSYERATRPEPAISPGALEGVRVLEVGSLIAGPFAGRLLAEMGADVIKIEAPGHPDPLRQWGMARHRERTLWWAVQSRNKRLATLDLRQERGQELFRSLAERSDVVLENFRPGTLERWNIGWKRLHGLNPQLIMARVSGFGQTGPLAARGGFAAVAEAVGGLRHINGYPDEPPPRTGISLGDSLAALFALDGILAALYWRDARGGDGQLVDVALSEACYALLESAVPEYAMTGADREPQGATIGANVPSNIFRTRDDRWVVIAANTDSLFRRLAEVLGQPELAAETRFATHASRTANQESIEQVISSWVAGRDAADVDAVMAASGIPCGPVNRISDIFADEQFAAREMLVPMHDDYHGTVTVPGVVPKLSETPGQLRWTGGSPGQHNAEVYGELLGLEPTELAELAAEGIV